MDIKWLEDFLSITSTASFSRSAEERHVTQPALSRRIRQLEDWVGTRLIDRATYPVSLTQAGQDFALATRDALHILYDMRDINRGRQGALTNTISFASDHTLSLTFFPQWIATIVEEIPTLCTKLNIDHSSMEARVLALGDGTCDFLLTYTHPSVPLSLNPNRFRDLILGSEKLIPISAPKSDGKPCHHLEDGSDRPLRFLNYGAGTLLFHIVKRVIRDRHPPLQLKYENSTAEGLKAMAMQGLGLSWVPESIVKEELTNGRLVRAGSSLWDIDIDIRIFKCLSNKRRITERAWAIINRQT